MSQKLAAPPARVPAKKLLRVSVRALRKQHSVANKIRTVLEGQRGEERIAARCHPISKGSTTNRG